MEDIFTRGFAAGIVGGLASNVWSMFAGLMDMTTIRQADLIALLIFAHTPPFGWGEIIFAFLGHILVSGILGIIFAYWVLNITNRNLLFKGFIFSVTVWFAVYATLTLFQLPGTIPTPFKTAICDFVGAILFGLVLPLALRALTAKESVTSLGTSIVPVMKPLDHEEDGNKYN